MAKKGDFVRELEIPETHFLGVSITGRDVANVFRDILFRGIDIVRKKIISVEIFS